MSRERIRVDWTDGSPWSAVGAEMVTVFTPIVRELKGIRRALEKIAGLDEEEPID